MKKNQIKRVIAVFLMAAASLSLLVSCGKTYESGYEAGHETGRGAGYDAGYEAGYGVGYDVGYETGYQAGFQAGYEAGHGSGYGSGHGTGHAEGYEAGYNAGREAGYEAGFESGYEAGRQSGYEEGLSVVKPLAILFFAGGEIYHIVDSAAGLTAEEIFPQDPPPAEGGYFFGWYYDKNEWSKPFDNADFLRYTQLSGTISVYAKFEPATGILINQIFGIGDKSNDGQASSHSFIELYNTNDFAVNLAGFSVQAATLGTQWQKLDLSGTIPAKRSFLIVMTRYTNPSARLLINEYDMAWADGVLSNKDIKVALLKSTAPLTVANPFDYDGKGRKIPGYVDMIGVAGNDAGRYIDGYESDYLQGNQGNSKQRAVRRIDFADTDHNALDCETLDFRTADLLYRPRSTSFGAWTSIADEGVWYPPLEGMPTLVVNTQNGAPIVSKDIYIGASVSLRNTDSGAYHFEAVAAEIRGRGNTTWGAEKKPYRIKFASSQSMFGLPAARSWTLLSNPFDNTLSRNYLAYTLARNIARNGAFQSNSIFLELYLNGEYRGIYLLCDQVEVGASRVDIEEGSSELDTGYLLELNGEAYMEGVQGIDWFRVNYGYTRTISIDIKSPEPDKSYYSTDQLEYIKQYLTDFNNALLADGDSYLDYIDMDSWIDYFIVQEIFANGDMGWKSVFLYKEKGGKLFMGPVWDMDYSSNNANNANNFHTNNTIGYNPYDDTCMVWNRWVEVLLTKESFRTALRARWNEIVGVEIAQMLQREAEIVGDLQNALLRENQKYDKDYRYFTIDGILCPGTFEEEVAALFEFLTLHAEWFDQYVNSTEFLA